MLGSRAANGFDQRTYQGMFGKGLLQAFYVLETGWNLAAIISGRKNEGQALRLKSARKIECVPITQVNIHDGNVDGVRSDKLAGFRQVVGGAYNGSAEVG
jgi:hypothetical protein